MFKKKLTLVLAVMALGSSLLMAGAAAWQRSETPLDRALLVVLSCVTVAAVHLLPSLTKSRAMWPLWVGCFVLAIYGHAGFFAFAGIKAGEARSSQSVQVQTIKAQQARITETLDTIKARPLAQVAALLSRTTAQDRTDRDSLGDTHTQERQPHTPTALEVLREAVTAGKCKPTVASIRQFMQCGQAKASELRRELVA